MIYLLQHLEHVTEILQCFDEVSQKRWESRAAAAVQSPAKSTRIIHAECF